MTNEEMQKTMQFILEQQAQFAANFQKIEEGFKRTEESHAEAEKRISRLEGAVIGLFNMIERLTKAQEKTDEKVNALVESQAHTDERLNALITTVERYISERRNGNPSN